MKKKIVILFFIIFTFFDISYAQEGSCSIWHDSDSTNFDPNLKTTYAQWSGYKDLGLILDSCINNRTISYKTHWKLFINFEGKVINAIPIENVGECEKQIINQLKLMPNFVPAKIDNIPVCCTYILRLSRY